jgi:hypothetical protein
MSTAIHRTRTGCNHRDVHCRTWRWANEEKSARLGGAADTSQAPEVVVALMSCWRILEVKLLPRSFALECA